VLSGSPSQAEFFNDGAITPHIIVVEITQEPSSLADEFQESAPRRVVVLVLSEVFREFGNPSREDRHLDLDRPFVGIVSPVFLDYRRFCRLVQVVGVSWRLRNSNTEQLGGKTLAVRLNNAGPGKTTFRVVKSVGREGEQSIARSRPRFVVQKTRWRRS